jgi:GNAT superfamily N-acetyltransferase
MTNISYREATTEDTSTLAKIRGTNVEEEQHWSDRIASYMSGHQNPQQALRPRIIYVAINDGMIIGFIAGHLTRRFNCEGELQWINMIENYRQHGVASELVRLLFKWFIEQKSYRICVDPGNDLARQFYKKNGASSLNDHWMFWIDIRNIFFP